MINLFFVDEYYERVICWYVTEGRSRNFLFSCKFAFYDEAWRRQNIVGSHIPWKDVPGRDSIKIDPYYLIYC